MIAHGFLSLGPAGLKASGQTVDDLLARRAAEAGEAYARARLNEDTAWKANANTLTVDTPGLQVLEDNGNVLGLLHDASGAAAVFRIRFNYQDGAGGSDGLADPAPSHLINNVYCSVNNLAVASPAKLPVVDPSTFVASLPADPAALTTPARSVCLQIEGMVGPAIQALTRVDDPIVGRAYHPCAIRVDLVRGQGLPVMDAPIMAGGGIDIVSPNGANVTVKGAPILPKLRSKKGIRVTDGAPKRLSCPGVLNRDPSQGVVASLVGSPKLVNERVGDGKDFLSLRWTQLPTLTDPQTVQLNGGTYVFWPDGSCHYYDLKFDAYKATIAAGTSSTYTIPTTGFRFKAPSNAGTLLSPDFREVRGDTNSVGLEVQKQFIPGVVDPIDFFVTPDVQLTNINLTANLKVIASSSGATNLCFTDLDGRALYPGDSRYTTASSNPNEVVTNAAGNPAYQNFVTLAIDKKMMRCDGELQLLVNLNAKDATVASTGNIVVASPSVNVLRTSPTAGEVETDVPAAQSISFFTGANLYFSSYQASGTSAFFNDLKLEGLLYAFGNITCYQDDPAGGVTREGRLSLKGAMIGYGADPALGTPGTGAGGQVQLFTNAADLTLDTQKLGYSTLFNPEVPKGNLVRCFYAVLK